MGEPSPTVMKEAPVTMSAIESGMVADNEGHDWKRQQVEWIDLINYWKGGGPMRPSAYERLQREEWGEALW